MQHVGARRRRAQQERNRIRTLLVGCDVENVALTERFGEAGRHETGRRRAQWQLVQDLSPSVERGQQNEVEGRCVPAFGTSFVKLVSGRVFAACGLKRLSKRRSPGSTEGAMSIGMVGPDR